MKLHIVVIGMILWMAPLPGTAQIIALSEPPRVSSLTGPSVTIRWETKGTGSTEARIGRDPLYQTEFVQNAGPSTSHTLTIPFRYPSELIRVQAFSVSGSDTAWAPEQLMIAPSSSSGQIRTLFNSTTDTSVSLGILEAEYLPSQLDDELILYIDQAEKSIDMAIYNLDTDGISDIIEALNRAFSRGVTVRIVCDGNISNSSLEALHPSIGKIASPPADYPYHGLMDNKFVVFDARSEDPLKPVVWTGSANFTDVQLNLDPNNVIVIQDQSLAIAYQMEFNEMYGTDGRLPNPQVARFGPDKSNNTPHEFVIGGSRVECYFSPSDGAEEHILSSISSADFTIEVATILITILEMGEAMLVRHSQGCDVKVLVNDRNPFGEPVLGILLPVLQEDLRLNGEPGLMHHKYLIVDQAYAGMDPLLLTGSHNWNGNAEVVNDENTLIIHDQGVANAYYQEFVNRFGAGQLLVSAENNVGRAGEGTPLRVFPNPSQDWIRFSLDPGDEPLSTSLVNAAGRTVREILPEARMVDLRGLPEGVYYLKVMVKNGTPLIQKILVVR